MADLASVRREYDRKARYIKDAGETMDKNNSAVVMNTMNQYITIVSCQEAQRAGLIWLSDVDNCELLARSVFARKKVEEQIDWNRSWYNNVEEPKRHWESNPESPKYLNKNQIAPELLPGKQRKIYNKQLKKRKNFEPIIFLIWLVFFALYALGILALEGALGAALMREHADNVLTYAFTWEVTGIDGPVIIVAGLIFQLFTIIGFLSDKTKLLGTGLVISIAISVIGGGIAFYLGTEMTGERLLPFAPIIVFVVAIVVNFGIVFVLYKILLLLAEATENNHQVNEQLAWKKAGGPIYIDELNYSKKKEYEKKIGEKDEFQKKCDEIWDECCVKYNDFTNKYLWWNATLVSLRNTLVALINNNTFLPASFKDDFSIVFIYRELREGLSYTLKEAKQRCEAKKDMESFKRDMLGLIGKGFSMLGDNLNRQLKQIGYDLEAKQSAAFRELSFAQEQYQRELSSAQEQYQRDQAAAVKKLSDDQSAYYKAEKKANEQTRKAIESALKKLTD